MQKLQKNQKGVRSDDSLQILKERLAQGEINEDEYEKLKKVLKKD
ncbi:SHOCT domain-containing protein [Staphylococcus epidermidis]